MTDSEVSNRLEAKLDTLIKLTAMQLISGEMPVREKALLLSRAGLQVRDIAAICDTTPNTVSVALSVAKKEKKS